MMCGICGIFTFDQAACQPEYASAIRRMMHAMHRRGPDAGGQWADPDGHVQLGFRRLAVLDLTPAANQPMHSSTERSVIVFNGEIYNYLDLRSELSSRGWQFHTKSDTEVLLAALETWGVEAIPRLNGMFALAWYDRTEQQLLLARDHAGIKPLYYFIESSGKGLVFGSQYNQLKLSPWGEPGSIRLDVLHLYLRLQHIPPPYELLQHTYQLEPGHWLLIQIGSRIDKHCWWRLPRHPHPDLSGEAAIEASAAALDNAVRRQRMADVPLGVFMSGGVDSPLVTAVARQQTDAGLQAYTIGNPGWRQDESADAQRYAAHLDVDFHLHNVSGEQMVSLLPEVWAAQTEPFGDFSILPTLLVSRFARQSLTVALSGDGGDELFFGYERPRSLLSNGAAFRFPWMVRYGLYAAGRFGMGQRRSGAIAARSPGDYYYNVNCRMRQADLKRLAPALPGLPADFGLYDFGAYQGVADLAHYSRYVEFYGQLQRGLKKVDMASMHYSLEVRVPLLDREVIETSLRIDPFTHMQYGQRKFVLQRLLARYVPSDIIPTPKRGFAVPLGDWMRGPLQPLVEEMLFGKELYPAGLFDLKGLRAYWQAHLNGEKDHKWGLWTLLALQGWAHRYL